MANLTESTNKFVVWLEKTGTYEVARLLGTSPQTVKNWRRSIRKRRRGKNATRPTETNARKIVRASGGKVNLPDIYGAFAQ